MQEIEKRGKLSGAAAAEAKQTLEDTWKALRTAADANLDDKASFFPLPLLTLPR